MRRFILLPAVLAFSMVWIRADDPAASGTTVTVTQRAPIELLSPSGDVTGVKESTVGTKLTLVSYSGTQLILQDAQGVRYEMAASATDYAPPPPAATPAAPKPATSAIATTPARPPEPAAADAPARVIPPPTRPISPATATAPSATASSSTPPSDTVFTTTMDDRDKDNVVAVWPQGGVAGRPLLIAAHGNGGSGPNEIKGWLALAKQHNFTIVCPSLQSSVNSKYLPSDTPYFRHILRWIGDNLQYDKDNVYMTGFSGGGGATWYLATQRPDFFRGLFLQSGNFWGSIDGLNLNRWSDRPIEVIWGSQDLADILTEGQNALDALKAADCKNVVHTVVQGAGHQEHQDMVVTWMEQVASTPAASN